MDRKETMTQWQVLPQRLTPMQRLKPVLGRGGTSIVYGPFTYEEIVTMFGRGPERTDDTMRFIVKVVTKDMSISRCREWVARDGAMFHLWNTLPVPMRDVFIVPHLVGCTPTQKIEVQRWGGTELFDVLADQKLWGLEDPRSIRFLGSLVYLMDACLSLVTQHGIFVTDLKPENMAIDDEQQVRVIDTDFLHIDEMARSRVYWTAYDPYLPVQFAHLLGQKVLPRFKQSYRRHNTSGWTPQHQRLWDRSKTTAPAEIARFSIIWLFAHTILIFFEYKCKPEKGLLHTFKRLVIDPLTKERLSMNDHVIQQIHFFVSWIRDHVGKRGPVVASSSSSSLVRRKGKHKTDTGIMVTKVLKRHATAG